MRMGPKGQRLSAKTLREYKTIMRRFSAFVGNDRLLERITIADGTRYVASLQISSDLGKALSASSVNKHKRVLISAMNVAVQQLGYLPVNPFLGRLKQDKIADQPIRYVTPNEFDHILAACAVMPDPLWWEAFLTVCYTAATRLNEAVHLRWSDVDFEANTIRIIAKPELDGLAAWRPKDHNSRTIPVPECTITLLGRLHAVAEPGTEFVFIPPARIEWIHAKRKRGDWTEGQDVLNNVNKNFQRRARNAGVTDVTLHDLRRSAITHWARKLATPVVKELAGHADISTTLRYYVSIRAADMADARDVTAAALQLDAKWTQNEVMST